jgi:SAM-dependent methyltransferase
MSTGGSSGHYYDDQEFDYPEYWRRRKYEDFSERIALKKLLNRVKKQHGLGNKMHILDIGAGYGRLVDTYFSFSRKITLLEPSLKLINLAKKRLCNYSCKIDFVPATIEEADLPSNFYDLVIAVRVIHHLQKPNILFQKVFSSLKPGGFFILEFANKNNFKLLLKGIFDSRAKEQFSLSRVDRRSLESIKEGAIPFYNYHPNWIRRLLLKNGYQIKERLSVSNLRYPLIKKILPDLLLFKLESLFQSLFSPLFFAPSIFVLSQKPES